MKSLLAYTFIGATLATAQPWRNDAGHVLTSLPSAIAIGGRYIIAPTEADILTEYRPAQTAAIPEGHQITSESWEIVDGVAVQSVETEPIPPRVPDARLLAIAEAYRTTLRSMYGDNAETDRAVTRQRVEDDLLAMTMHDQGVDAIRAAMVLERGFEAICQWTGSAETWSFFDAFGELLEAVIGGTDSDD